MEVRFALDVLIATPDVAKIQQRRLPLNCNLLLALLLVSLFDLRANNS